MQSASKGCEQSAPFTHLFNHSVGVVTITAYVLRGRTELETNYKSVKKSAINLGEEMICFNDSIFE